MNATEYTESLRQTRPFGWILEDPPTIESFAFERVDPFYWHKLIEDSWRWCYYAGVVYLITIFGLKEYMKNRPAYELKSILFFWNLGLGIFSIVGFCRTAPEFVSVLSKPNGFYHSICLKEGINVPCAYWIMLFAFSKFVELGDTVFIVLRKRPLIFLQWYHHLVTLWVVWTVAPLVEPISRWYAVLNYGVHSLMYPYFAFKTIGLHIPRKIANTITTLQLAQMIIGFSVNMISLYLQQTGYNCVRYPLSIKAFNLVYGTFICLFGKLFYDSVMRANRKHKKLLKSE